MPVSSYPVSSQTQLNSHFDHEMEDWQRIVNFMQDENILLKDRLSTMLKSAGENAALVLERAEYFHDLFLKEDEIAGFLRNEMKSQQKLLQRQQAQNGGQYAMKQSGWMQDKLGNLVLLAARNFNNLKLEFNSYAAELMQMRVV